MFKKLGLSLFLILTSEFVFAGCAHKLRERGDCVQGMASWYGQSHHGRRTASGERFNMNALTAAHRSLPMNSMVQVKSLSTGNSVVVRINDRGPYAKARVIDVSYEAARRLEMVQKGTDEVEIEVISTPPR